MDKHSKEWNILRYQGQKHKREKAVLYAIILLLIIALVLSNIVWYSRHNNETASAATPVITQAVDDVSFPPTIEKPRRKERVIRDTGG